LDYGTNDGFPLGVMESGRPFYCVILNIKFSCCWFSVSEEGEGEGAGWSFLLSTDAVAFLPSFLFFFLFFFQWQGFRMVEGLGAGYLAIS